MLEDWDIPQCPGGPAACLRGDKHLPGEPWLDERTVKEEKSPGTVSVCVCVCLKIYDFTCWQWGTPSCLLHTSCGPTHIHDLVTCEDHVLLYCTINLKASPSEVTFSYLFVHSKILPTCFFYVQFKEDKRLKYQKCCNTSTGVLCRYDDAAGNKYFASPDRQNKC